MRCLLTPDIFELLNILLNSAHKGLSSQPRVIPPDGDYSITDFSQWVADPNTPATDFLEAALLGIVSPQRARLNAPNYVMFAICLAFEDLDCLSLYRLIAPGRR